MKKIQYTLLALLAVSLIASCTLEPIDVPENQLGDLSVFTAVAAQPEDGTKAALAEEGAIKWSPNDEIEIFSGASFDGVYQYQGTEAAASAEFTYTSGTITNPDIEKGFWAVYPSTSAAGAAVDGTSVTVTVPKDQTATAGTFDPAAFVAVAHSSGFALSFFNVCGGFKFKVTRSDVTKVEFHAVSGEALAGTATVQMDANGRPSVTAVASPETTITLSAPENQTLAADQWYYISCLPTALSGGFTMTLATSSEFGVVSHDTPLTVKRSTWGRLNTPVSATTYNLIISDPAAKAICVANWDTNGDGEISLTEAAAVSNSDLGTTFKNNTEITNLSFLKAFTGLTSIPSYAFSECTGLESITIPEGVTQIGHYAFWKCGALQTLSLPGTLTEIGDHTFSVCSSLKNVSIPEGVVHIDNNAFSQSGLESVTLPSTATNLGDGIFGSCPDLESVSIKAALTAIRSYMFHNCQKLTTVNIPEGVTYIQVYAFNKCNLSSIVLPNSLRYLDNYSFSETPLTSVTIPEGALEIRGSAFANCTQLQEITVPSTITSIEGYAFSGCSSLTGITLPAGVTSIGASLFSGCTSLGHVTMLGNITSIGEKAFYNCSSLGSITIPGTVISIESSAFSGCTHLESVTVPSGVTSLSSSVFSYCTGLTSVSLPIGLTLIDMFAFMGCSSLSSISIPNTVYFIGNSAFSSTGLTSVTLPTDMISIGTYSFNGCKSLTTVTVPLNTPPEEYVPGNSHWFNGCDVLTAIYVPAGRVDTYKAAGGWSDYADKIQAIPAP